MTEWRRHQWVRLAAVSAVAALSGLAQHPTPAPRQSVTRVLGEKLTGNGGGSGDNGNGKNNGNGNDGKDFTISGSAAGLYPGASKPLVVTLANSNNFAIKVTMFSAVVGNANASCAGSNVRVDAPVLPLVIPANGTTTASLLARMTNNPPNACKNVSFGLIYTGTAVKA